MKFVALFRGINVGRNNRISMKELKVLFERLGYTNVSTYINSGNVVFESTKKSNYIRRELEKKLKNEFGFETLILVKTEKEMKSIADMLPYTWENDTAQRSDVAYLFPEIDSEKTINELPVNKEFFDIRYVKGAIFWNVHRKNYNKSHLNKIISHKLYQFMTVRNIHTAKFLAGEN